MCCQVGCFWIDRLVQIRSTIGSYWLEAANGYIFKILVEFAGSLKLPVLKVFLPQKLPNTTCQGFCFLESQLSRIPWPSTDWIQWPHGSSFSGG